MTVLIVTKWNKMEGLSVDHFEGKKPSSTTMKDNNKQTKHPHTSFFFLSSFIENAISLSAHEHINIQTIIIQKNRIASKVSLSLRQMSNLREVQITVTIFNIKLLITFRKYRLT